MYLCIEVALHRIAHGIGKSNWAWGKGPSIKWVQCPNPAGNIGSASRTLAHTLLWAAKGDLFPHIGGAESHRERLSCCEMSLKQKKTAFVTYKTRATEVPRAGVYPGLMIYLFKAGLFLNFFGSSNREIHSNYDNFFSFFSLPVLES